MCDPFKGDIAGYVQFMVARGISPRFTDARAFYELLEEGFIGPYTSIGLEDGVSTIGIRRKNGVFETSGGVELDNLDSLLDGPWYLESFDRTPLYERGFK
ncbi:MAG: hypothetical protein ACMXYM_01005 [Candidatus Woesearchaeota archaeon]